MKGAVEGMPEQWRRISPARSRARSLTCPWSKPIETASDAIVEPCTQRQHEISVLHGVVGRSVPMHTKLARDTHAFQVNVSHDGRCALHMPM